MKETACKPKTAKTKPEMKEEDEKLVRCFFACFGKTALYRGINETFEFVVLLLLQRENCLGL